MSILPMISTKGFITLGENPRPAVVVMFTTGMVSEGLVEMVRPEVLKKVKEIQLSNTTMSLNTITVFDEMGLGEIISKVESTAVERKFERIALFSPANEVKFYEEDCGYTKAVYLGRGKGYFMTKDLVN